MNRPLFLNVRCPTLAAAFQGKNCRKGGNPRNSMSPLFALLPSALTMALLAACLLTPSAASAQQSRADAEKDLVLKAMLTELDRNMSQLQLQGFVLPQLPAQQVTTR